MCQRKERESIITINSDPWKGEIIKHRNDVIYFSDQTRRIILLFFRNNKSISFFHQKTWLHFSPPIFWFFFHAGPHLSGGNCWHAHVVLWVSWFIQPKISPSSFSLSIRMIISFSIKFSKDGSGKNISPGIKMVARTHPHHSRHNATSRTQSHRERAPWKTCAHIFWQYRRKNIFPVSNRWRKKRREKQESRRGLMTALPSFFHFLGVAFWIRASIFCVTGSDKIERKKKKSRTSAGDTIATGQTWNRWHVNWHRHTACHTQHTWCHLSISREKLQGI